jgi:hypothetical protein
MAQASILRTDLHPQDAILTGKDFSVCATCKHRGHRATNSRGVVTTTRSCYVTPMSLFSVYHALKRGSYPRLAPSVINEQIRRRAVLRGTVAALRLGAYGDPAAVPTRVWTDMVKDLDVVAGYSHAWKHCDQTLKSLMMASADTPEEAGEAQAMGWRTFRIIKRDQKPTSAETLCRNVRTGATCQDCGLCAGTAIKAKHVAIPLHGSKRVHFHRNLEMARLQPPDRC